MPPKTSGKVEKAASKKVEDLTFGMKNKNKSKKVQQYMQSVKSQAVHNMTGQKSSEQIRAERERKEKEAAAAAEKELALLLRSSIRQPKLDAGVDPKSVLCEFFKQHCCDKGDKCKYSHDLLVGRKAAKISVYTDRRDDDKAADTIDSWDAAKLEEVVKTKHGAEKKETKTDIVCMYFLDALERELYGWFWNCPNGPTCKYRHALPPGYVFKTKREREAEAALKAEAGADVPALEEAIEEERKKLPTAGLTPVTAETFAKWKEDRAARRARDVEAKRVEEAKKSGGKGLGVLSGRALFTYDPSLFVDDGDAAAAEEYDAAGADEEEEGGGSGGGEEEEEGGRAGAGGPGGVGPGIAEDLYAGGDDLEGVLDDEEEEDGEGGGAGDADGGGEAEEEGEADEGGAEDDAVATDVTAAAAAGGAGTS